MDGVKIDGALWILESNGREYQAICPLHYLPLEMQSNWSNACQLRCPEDFVLFNIPREWNQQIRYIHGRLGSKELKKLKFINLDDEAIPIAEDKAKSEDDKFFVTARIMDSKVGRRLVIYAGERGRSEKTQIFVEPEVKRLSFDQKDLNPADVFLKVEAEFADGTKHTIEKK